VERRCGTCARWDGHCPLTDETTFGNDYPCGAEDWWVSRKGGE